MILGSLGTMKNIISKYSGKIRKMFGLTALCLVIIVGENSLCQANLDIYGDYEPVYEENYSIIPKLVHLYTLSFINNKGELVETEFFEDELPNITKLNDALFEVSHSIGQRKRSNIYFDANLGVVTRSYLNPIYVGQNIIVYFDQELGEQTLIIKEMFSDNGIYMEIVRDFSPSTIKIEVLLQVSLINQDTIKIVYLQGENFEEITEEISIW